MAKAKSKPKAKAKPSKKAAKPVAKAPVEEKTPSADAAGHAGGASWKWFASESGGRLQVNDTGKPISLAVDFGRPFSIVSCQLGGSGLGPKVEGTRMLVRCRPGFLDTEVSWVQPENPDINVSPWEG